ncbi:chlorophyll a/b-binding protein [Prochlorococcus marinus]|uniref:chlorophyll a/b-binding protein n=1 Tax=Prochlorococcus marinus TaxID=1219 RepID=UPI0022B4585D|nr:chlorophyll a/b-binding protein [Prochlorococcus marinus]
MTTSTPSLTAKKSLVVTEYGKQNMFAYEAPMQLEENYTNYPEEAEKTNGRWAMIGFVSLMVSYVFTGQVLPGVF